MKQGLVLFSGQFRLERANCGSSSDAGKAWGGQTPGHTSLGGKVGL